MHSDFYRLLIALGIGAIIGAKREYRNKSAGLRTMIMVSLSSCLFTMMSLKIGVDSHDRAGFCRGRGDFLKMKIIKN
jgi:putative Mg2+ transporter-C (MgtC) family protein